MKIIIVNFKKQDEDDETNLYFPYIVIKKTHNFVYYLLVFEFMNETMKITPWTRSLMMTVEADVSSSFRYTTWLSLTDTIENKDTFLISNYDQIGVTAIFNDGYSLRDFKLISKIHAWKRIFWSVNPTK